jgi:hypothetical protein
LIYFVLVEGLIKSKMEGVLALESKVNTYGELGLKEEDLKLQIALKTGTMMQGSQELNSYTDYGEGREQVGGVLIKEPLPKALSPDEITNTASPSPITLSISEHSLNQIADDLSQPIVKNHSDISHSILEQRPTLSPSVSLVDTIPFQSISGKQQTLGSEGRGLSKSISEGGSLRRLLSMGNESSHKSTGPISPLGSESSLNEISETPRMSRSKSKRVNRPPRVIVSQNKSLEVEMIQSPKLSHSPRFGHKIMSNGNSMSSGANLNTLASLQSAGFSPSSTTDPIPISGSIPNLSKISISPAQSLMSLAQNGTSAITPRAAPSIKDFDVVKPISKGAFGSVFLAKKRLTGEYYAIKVLRKSDMIAKNQVMNIKAERMILAQLDSPYVVKLYFSFQSKDNLYLVMEYLNGGDCAALIKAVGQLDEKWAKQYVSEVVLGLEFLHSRNIFHR